MSVPEAASSKISIPPNADLSSFAALLKRQRQRVVLEEPESAPDELLHKVDVDLDGAGLIAASDAGEIALKIFYGWNPETGEGETEAIVHSPMKADLDPDAEGNPPLTLRYPHAELPYGTNFGFKIVAPTDISFGRFTEPEQFSQDDVDAFTLRKMFPGYMVDFEARYDVRAMRSSRRMLWLLARYNGEDPLFQRRVIESELGKERAKYYERRITAPFHELDDDPSRSSLDIAHSHTWVGNSDDVDIQPLRIIADNKSQQGAGGDAGLLEVIAFTSAETTYSAEEITMRERPRPRFEIPRDDYYGGSDVVKGIRGGGTPLSFSSPAFGQARITLGTAERVKSGKGINIDPRTMVNVAAFRIALVGANVEAARG